MREIKILLLFLVGLLSDAISFDSAEDGYAMFINHHDDPWWGFNTGDDSLGSSFQYFYPFIDNNNHDPTSFDWHHLDLPPIRPPVPPSQPAQPIQPTPPSQSSDSSTREWPSWLPPIRLIKLPLDEPPVD